jgi:adenylate kinase
MNIILLGPPGAGKGTQARMLQDSYQLDLISTGDILREEIKRGTAVGLEVKKTMDEGLYPSDEIILLVFEKRLKESKAKGFILDGIPRTLNQAQKVDKIFESLGLVIDVVIHISVDDKELIRRLSNRYICKTCSAPYTVELPPRVEGVCDKCHGSEFVRRPDDEPEAIKTRLNVYNEQTKPLLHYYSGTDRLRVVDGMKSVEEVNVQAESLLRNLQVLTTNSGCLYSA